MLLKNWYIFIGLIFAINSRVGLFIEKGNTEVAWGW